MVHGYLGAGWWRREAVLALRNVSRTPRRTLPVVGAIAFGVVAIVLAGGFIEWNLWYGRESIIHSQFGHISVFRPGYLDKGLADPYQYLLPAGGAALSEIRAEPGVVGVAPHLNFSGLVSHGDITLSFLGVGVDPIEEQLLSSGIDILSGRNIAPSARHGVLLGKGLAAALGVHAGDRLVLLVNKSDGSVNASDATVQGTFSTVLKAYDDVAIRLPIDFAHQLTRTTGMHSWAIVLSDTRLTDSVLTSLRSKLPPGRFDLVPWYHLSDFYLKVVNLYSRQFAVVQLIVAMIMILGIGNSMMMNVLERTSEIGTAMALGRNRRSILRLFLIEGVILGIVGGAIGLTLSLFLAHLISAVGIPMPPSPGMSKGFEAGIKVTRNLAFEGVALAIGAALIASAYPAWRGCRMVIVDALRAGR